METIAIYFGLILARVGTFVAVMPLFADRAPRIVRVGLALALAVFYFTAIGPKWDPAIAAAHSATWLYALALLREAVIGAAMGFAFSLFLLPAQIAGAFVSEQVGLALGPQPGPTGQSAASPLAMAFEIMAAIVFLELNGHHVLLAALHASFAKLPLGGSIIPQPIAPMLDGMARAHEMGVLLGAPLGLCLLLLTVVLAFMARVAPQLNIYTIGFTLQAIVALLGMSLLLPEFVRLLLAFTGETGQSINRFLG